MCVAGAKAKNVALTDPVYRERLARELAMIAEKKFEDYFYIVAELVNWAKERMIVGPARGSSCGSLVCYLLNITAVDPIPFGLLFERFIDITRSDLPDIDIDFEDEKRNLVFQHAAELYGAERIARLGNVNHFKARSALKAAATALRIPDFMINKVMDVMIERTSGDARANEALADTFKATDVGRSLRAEYPALQIAERMEGHL
jgi:DNA polymerase III alpha subunit